MAKKVGTAAVVRGDAGFPQLIKIQVPDGTQPIGFHPAGQDDLQITLFVDDQRPPSTLEFLLVGSGQDFPDLQEKFGPSAGFTTVFVGSAGTRQDPDTLYHLWLVNHTSRLVVARETHGLPNGGAQTGRG